VVDEQGKNIGVMSRDEALARAREQGVDLIEISEHTTPPIAKLISYDKLRYQQEREEKKQRIHQKQGELKQVRISGRAAENDLRVWARRVDEFLGKGHKVEIMLVLRGREKANEAWAFERLAHFLTFIDPEHKISTPPKRGGRGIIMQVDKNK